jgi:hypothetical protein
MIFSAESVYSVKTAVVSDGLEDTFSILLGMAFSISLIPQHYYKIFFLST